MGLYDFYDDETSRKRTLSIRDKQIVYDRARGKCENCHKKISFTEMQLGHKNRAFSRGGSTSTRNSACLCYGCNKKQGTDTWKTFQKSKVE